MEPSDFNIPERTWKGRALLLVDLDAFFASVEQLDHPEWRGKPVIVGGRSDRRGVVSTASYEARAFGVHSAMPSATAERLCPDAIWTSSHFDRYHELSAQVMGILKDESPLPGRYTGEDPVAIAARIQARVAELGITCSIGVATGKAVAKIASDMDKPRGLTVVYPGGEAAFLAPMDVRAMPGIGKQSAERLRRIGIRTLGALADTPLDKLTPLFGVNAQAIRDRAQGIDPREIATESEVKSVSHERTFATDLVTREEIEDAIDMLGPMVGRRLRKKGLAGHTVTIKLRYADLSRRTAQKGLPANVDDETVFIPVAKRLIDEIWCPGDSVRLVGLGISGFEAHDEQLGLFADEELPAGNAELLSAADKIRDKFGDGMLKFGRELKIRHETSGTTGMNDGRL